VAPPDTQRVIEDYRPGPSDHMIRLPGKPSQVSRARALVASALGRDHPLYDDVVLLTSELATNAILHSRSGAGGSFTVSLASSRGAVRVFVTDSGSDRPPCICRTGAQDTNGRGLPLIRAISAEVDIDASAGGTTVRMTFSPSRQVCGNRTT